MKKTNQITTKSAVLSILFFIGTVLNKTNVHYIATLLICLLALFLIWYEPRKTTWFESKKMPLWSKITSNVIAVSFFLSPLIFSDRQTILIYSALPLICAAAMVYCVFKTKNTEKDKDRRTSRSPTTYDFTFIADGKEIKSHHNRLVGDGFFALCP